MINDAHLDTHKLLRTYGMKSVLEAMILYLGYEFDYEIRLKVNLRKALDEYEERYENE